MARSVKLVLRVVLGLLLVIAAAIGVFVATFDPNRYRATIGNTIEDITGRRLTINGDLSLSVWPVLALRAEHLELGPAPGVSAAATQAPEPMLRIAALDATIQLEPLLRRQVRIRGVVLHEPKILLRGATATESNNWSDLLEALTTAEPGSAPPADVQLQRLAVRSGTLNYVGESSYRITALNIDADFSDPENLALGASGALSDTAGSSSQPFELTAPVVKLTPEKDAVEVPELEATLAGTQMRLSLRAKDLATAPDLTGAFSTEAANLPVLAPLLGLVLPDGLNPAALAAVNIATNYSVLTDARGLSLTLTELRFNLADLGVSGTARLQRNPTGQVAGSISATDIDLQRLIKQLPDLASSNLASIATATPPPGPVALRSDFRWQPEATGSRLELTNTRVKGRDLSVGLSGELLSDGSTIRLNLTTQTSEFSPKQALTYFGQAIATGDPTALTQATGSARVSYDPNGMMLNDLRLTLDDSQISGQLGYNPQPPGRWRFELTTDALDVARYLPPIDTKSGLADLVWPTELLAAVNLTGRTSIGRLLLYDLTLNNTNADVKVDSAGAEMRNLTTQLYGGSFAGNLRLLQPANSAPELHLNGALKDIAIDQLLLAASGSTSFTGTGSLDVELSGVGATALNSIQTAAGTFALQLANGSFTGVNLGHSLCRLYNQLRGHPLPGPPPNRETVFDTFSASARVTNGVAQTSDILASNSYLKLSGEGRARLARQSIDYELDVELTGPIDYENCETLTPFIGKGIPVKLTGTFLDPVVRPDFGKLAQREIRRRVEEKITEKLLDLLGGKRSEQDTESEPEPEIEP